MAHQHNPQLKNINLSLRLLSTASASPFHSPPALPSLSSLANRLRIANLAHSHRKNEREGAKEWLMERGVNLANAQDIAREVKKRQNVQKIKRVQYSNWEKLEFQTFDTLDVDDFLHCSEERNAHIALKLSLNKRPNNHHLNNLASNLARLSKGNEEEKVVNKRQQEDCIEQFIAKYEENANSSAHKLTESAIGIDRFLWLRILYYQVEMVEYLGREEPKKRNYLLTVALKELEKNAREKHNFSSDFWKAAFLEYRSGCTDFPPTRYPQDNELLESLRQIHNSLINFQEISIESSTDLNVNDDLYERVLKLIVLGRYTEGLFEDKMGDDTWLVILSSGVRRANKSQKEQNEQFKRSVKSLIGKHKERHLQGEESLNEVIACLLSLGSYERILQIYKQLNSFNELPNRFLFIQLFIILASNSELIEEFNPSSKKKGISRNAEDILAGLVEAVARYAEEKKSTNFHLYAIIVEIVFKIISDLEKRSDDWTDLAGVADILKLSHVDLWHCDCDKLSDIAAQSEHVRNIIDKTLIQAKPHSNDEYLKLAQLCRRFNSSSIMEHLFLRFLIISELDRPSSVQPRDDTVEEIMYALRPTLSQSHLRILDFLNDLSTLRGLVTSRSIDQLTAKRIQFESHLGDRSLLQALVELCAQKGADLMEIYVLYCEQIYAMQKLVHLARSNVSYLRKKQNELAKQLEQEMQKYPEMDNLRMGQLIYELLK